jgi:hypothetical protein
MDVTLFYILNFSFLQFQNLSISSFFNFFSSVLSVITLLIFLLLQNKAIKEIFSDENFESPEKAYFVFCKYESILGVLDFSEAVQFFDEKKFSLD